MPNSEGLYKIPQRGNRLETLAYHGPVTGLAVVIRVKK